MAHDIGLRIGDQIVAIGSTAVATRSEIVDVLRRVESERVALAYRREGALFEGDARVARWPAEEIEGCRVAYETLERPGARVRTIVTTPDDRVPAPALLYLQGFGAISIDFAIAPDEPCARLLHGIARSGMVTMRVERRGVGDSDGVFHDVDFETEHADVRAAFESLRARDDVDPERVFVFAHSVGGAHAALLANRCAGVALYGASAMRWDRWLLASAQRQIAAKPLGVDDRANELATYETALAQVMSGEVDSFHQRCAAFHRQLAALDLERIWRDSGATLLAVHGSYDCIVAEEEVRGLLPLVERSRFLSIDGLDHAFTRHASLAASNSQQGRGEPDARLLAAFLDFAGSIGEASTLC